MPTQWLALLIGRIEAMREAVGALDVHLDVSTWHEVWSAEAGREVP